MYMNSQKIASLTKSSFPKSLCAHYPTLSIVNARDTAPRAKLKKQTQNIHSSRLQSKGNNEATDESDGASNQVSTSSDGDLAGDGGGLRGRDGLRGAESGAGGGRRERSADDDGGVPLLGRGGRRGPGRGGVGSMVGRGLDGGRGGLRRARSQGDGLDAGGGRNNVGGLASAVLRRLGLLRVVVVALDDLEGERVLEDLRVALELHDETVGVLGAEGSVDGPLVGLSRVLDAASNVGNGDKSALAGTTDQRDGDSLVLVLWREPAR